MRPNVKIIIGNGRLGQTARSLDGVALLVATCDPNYIAAVGSASVVCLQPKDAEDAGITEAQDLAFQSLVWEHIRDFYIDAPLGTELHVLLLSSAVTATNLFTPANANYATLRQYLYSQSGRIRLIGLALNPALAEVATPGGISADLAAAIPLAQDFYEAEFAAHRPVNIFLEGRMFDTTAALATDLRALASNMVSVVISKKRERSDVLSAAGHVALGFAQIGRLLGRVAAIPVQRSIGRVKDGKLQSIGVGALSGGDLITSLSEADLDALTDKGYIMYVKHAGKDGYFYNLDSTCSAKTDDYSLSNRGRVINKAARIARAVYLEELLDEVEVDQATGQLPPIEVARFKNVLENAIADGMAGEIVGATVIVDSAQDVLSSNKIQAGLRVIPKGVSQEIEATVEFENPARN